MADRDVLEVLFRDRGYEDFEAKLLQLGVSMVRRGRDNGKELLCLA